MYLRHIEQIDVGFSSKARWKKKKGRKKKKVFKFSTF